MRFITRRRSIRRNGSRTAGLEPLDGSKFHAYRRKFATERGHLPDHVVMDLMIITDPKVFNDCYRKRSDDQMRDGLNNASRVERSRARALSR